MEPRTARSASVLLGGVFKSLMQAIISKSTRHKLTALSTAVNLSSTGYQQIPSSTFAKECSAEDSYFSETKKIRSIFATKMQLSRVTPGAIPTISPFPFSPAYKPLPPLQIVSFDFAPLWYSQAYAP
jgi:hypothetical protein